MNSRARREYELRQRIKLYWDTIFLLRDRLQAKTGHSDEKSRQRVKELRLLNLVKHKPTRYEWDIARGALLTALMYRGETTNEEYDRIVKRKGITNEGDLRNVLYIHIESRIKSMRVWGQRDIAETITDGIISRIDEMKADKKQEVQQCA